MIGIRTAIAGSLGGGKSWDSDLVTYISGLATPLSSGQLTLLNNFILALKSGLSIINLSDAFDVMYILANETAEAALRNLVKRSHDATAVNNPTFTALEGFTGNGTSSYIDTNYNAATQAINYTLNTCSYGLYLKILSSVTTGDLFAATTTGRIEIIGNNSVTGNRVYLNALEKLISLTKNVGMWIDSRLSTTAISRMINKSYGTETNNAVIIPDSNVLIQKSAYGYSNSQLSFLFIGKDLTQANGNTITDAFEAYMDANGKGVI